MLRGRLEVVRVLRVDDEQAVESGYLGQGQGELVLVQVRELVYARRGEERLEAEDTGVVQRAQVLTLSGRAPPQKPTSMWAFVAATCCFVRRLSTVVVGGRS